MRTLVTAGVLLLAACNGAAPATDTATDTRMPISVQYVRGATLKIHRRASDESPLITTYQHGESVSVLSTKGSWLEVRAGSGNGWVHASDLASAAEATRAESDNDQPHFTRTPEPVSQPGASGEIVFEADVNTDGVVTNIRTLRNTTNSQSLEQRNIESLRRAVFTPVVRHGKREPFVYEHRVHY